jgi:TRAP transporter TAXI family solute receptor
MMSVPNDNPARSRQRRKRKSYALLILAAGMLAFGLTAGGLYYALRPTTLRIAVGPANSEDQKLVQLMAQTFAREGSPVRLSLVTTEGTAESIALFAAGKADLAVARGDLNLPTNAESVAILRKNFVVLWAPSGRSARGSKKQPPAKIKSLDELAGHRVGVIGRTQANAGLLRAILKESGVNPDKVTISQFATNQIGEMAKDQSVDAFMAVGPLKSKITVDAIAATAAARGEPKFLPIEVAEAIAKKNPIYEAEEIPASIFGSSPQRPEDKVDTVAVNHLIIAPKSLSDTAVAAFARQLFTNRQQLAREMPTASQIEKPDTDKDAALPAHAGAAAYIDGNERTFLEKYTDYIWFAVLILSGLGSAGAWLKHYWNKDEREAYIAHRDHLLELIARVRKAETPQELAEMQGAADSMLRETLDGYDDGTVEEGDLSVIALTLEQFHHAVADRRAVLVGAAAPDTPRMRVGQG